MQRNGYGPCVRRVDNRDSYTANGAVPVQLRLTLLRHDGTDRVLRAKGAVYSETWLGFKHDRPVGKQVFMCSE
jgi:hypothetical protein